MASDSRYDRLTAESLPLEKANIENFLQDHGFNTEQGARMKNSPWKLSKPSRRVAQCGVTYWIYNISPRRHAISSLPGMPKVLGEAREDKPFGNPLPIKEITLDYASRGDYKLDAQEVDDIDLVGAIICPSCSGKGHACKDTADLRVWGVFASQQNPSKLVARKAAEGWLFKSSDGQPVAEFQAAFDLATERLGNMMSNLVKFADNLWEDSKQRWQLSGAYGNVYRMAAKYKKIQRPWCTPLKDMETCAGCGQTNPNGAMVCSNATCGIILDYAKALRFRKITQQDFDEAYTSGLIEENGRLATV
jgi:hypothetical protein